MIDPAVHLAPQYWLLATLISGLVLLHQIVQLAASRRTWRRSGAGFVDGRTGLQNPSACWEVDALRTVARVRARRTSIILIRVPTHHAEAFGSSLRDRVRASDVAMRWDVDEFVVAVMTDSRHEAAVAVHRLVAGGSGPDLRCGITDTERASLWDDVRAASRVLRPVEDFRRVAMEEPDPSTSDRLFARRSPKVDLSVLHIAAIAGVLGALVAIQSVAAAAPPWSTQLVVLLQAWLVLRLCRRAVPALLNPISSTTSGLFAMALIASALHVDAKGLAAAGVLILAVTLGCSIGRVIDRGSWLVPVATIASLSDLQSFASGTTSRILASLGERAAASSRSDAAIPRLPVDFDLTLLLLPVRVPGGEWVAGSVDVLLIAALFAAADALRLPMLRTEFALLLGIGVAVAIGSPVPLIPFIMCAFVAAHAAVIVRASRYGLERMLRPT